MAHFLARRAAAQRRPNPATPPVGGLPVGGPHRLGPALALALAPAQPA
jgi:hypothetical protein